MNKFNAPTVFFKCCEETKVFTSPGQFSMCSCGSSGFDAGDGYYNRKLGNPPSDVVIIGYNIEKTEKYCKEHGLHYYPAEDLIVKFGTPYFIKTAPGKYDVFRHVESEPRKFIKTFGELKHANRYLKKLIKGG